MRPAGRRKAKNGAEFSVFVDFEYVCFFDFLGGAGVSGRHKTSGRHGLGWPAPVTLGTA